MLEKRAKFCCTKLNVNTYDIHVDETEVKKDSHTCYSSKGEYVLTFASTTSKWPATNRPD